MFNYFSIINNKLIQNIFLIIIHARVEQYFLHTQNISCAWWNMNCLFSIDFMPIDVRIYMFLNKTLSNNVPFESFPLLQFLLIVLCVKVTYISNGSQTLVAHSQRRASAPRFARTFGYRIRPCYCKFSEFPESKIFGIFQAGNSWNFKLDN